MSAFAQSAVHLKELYLLFGVPDDSEAIPYVLESLGHWCVHLERLWITCQPEWGGEADMRISHVVLFPNLWDLRIAGPAEGPDLPETSTEAYDLVDMTYSFAQQCPKLLEFWFLDPYFGHPWDAMVRRYISGRRGKVLWEPM
jgi:hypothetical protein